MKYISTFNIKSVFKKKTEQLQSEFTSRNMRKPVLDWHWKDLYPVLSVAKKVNQTYFRTLKPRTIL